MQGLGQLGGQLDPQQLQGLPIIQLSQQQQQQQQSAGMMPQLQGIMPQNIMTLGGMQNQQHQQQQVPIGIVDLGQGQYGLLMGDSAPPPPPPPPPLQQRQQGGQHYMSPMGSRDSMH